MLNVLYTVLDIGIEKPIKLLQVTDVHITEANENDPPEQIKLMKQRKELFARFGGNVLPPTEEMFKLAVEYAKDEGALLVVTGDVIDIHTEGNLEMFRSLTCGLDMMFTPGGHEYQKQCVRTLEEPDGYGKKMREQLPKDFPEYDLDFDSRIIGGVNIITANNALDYYNEYTVKRFEEELEKGMPIVVFSHDPINDSNLILTEPNHPNIDITPEEYKTSHRMIDKLLHHPLVKATFSGHEHTNREDVVDGKTHYITDGLFRATCRLIEIR